MKTPVLFSVFLLVFLAALPELVSAKESARPVHSGQRDRAESTVGPLIRSDAGQSPDPSSRPASHSIRPDRPLALREFRPLAVDSTGEPAIAGELKRAEPTALVAGDFDGDGVPDLLAGYGGPRGGLLVLHRGNADAIFPHSPGARRRREEGTFTASPFLAPARVFELPERPDFLAAGDFDNDGHWDAVAAERGGRTLYLLAGDGRGGLLPARRSRLPEITAMIAGEIDRADGLVDLVVGTDGPDGPAALVFEGPEGALRSEPRRVGLPATPTALLLDRLDEDALIDLAAATGEELVIVRGRDRRRELGEQGSEARALRVGERIPLPAVIRAIASGDFVSDRHHRSEIALLTGDGVLRLLAREGTGATQTGDGPHRGPNGLPMAESTPAEPGAWKTIGVRRTEGPVPGAAGADAAAQLLPTRLSGSSPEDLVILDAGSRRLRVLAAPIGAEPPTHDAAGPDTALSELQGVRYSVDLVGAPIAVLPMRLDGDALTDLVLFESGVETPMLGMSLLLATITVNTNADNAIAGDSACTLREAINNANTDTDTTSGDCSSGNGVDSIVFAIGGGGAAATITLTAALPAITDAVTIDGSTQGCPSSPCIDLRGNTAGAASDGLVLAAGSTTVRGLVVREFQGNGIRITSAAGGDILEGNFIGTDLTGTLDRGNLMEGVLIENSPGNTVGGTIGAARNVISGNDGVGVFIDGGSGNDVLGNFVGTDLNGGLDLGNGSAGLVVSGSASNTIGGTVPGAGNVFSGNDFAGMQLQSGAASNLVQGNLIGTDVFGLLDVGNFVDGVVIFDAPGNTIGGTAAGARNVVSGNDEDGIEIDEPASSANEIVGNLIGVNAAGTAGLGNGANGVLVFNAPDNTIGGSVAAARNVISANLGDGVEIRVGSSTGNQVVGNFIGTDVSGSTDLGNGANGVLITLGATDTVVGGNSSTARNVIAGNTGSGVFVDGASDNRVLGNFIGTDVTGSADLGNDVVGVAVSGSSSSTVIGGETSAERNLVSGNDLAGIQLQVGAALSQVLGNFIGTDVTGAGALANGFDGVVILDASGNTIGGTAPGARNVISGNGDDGVEINGINATGNQVLGNVIGLDVTESMDLGNASVGVLVAGAPGNLVGGTEAGSGNLIWGNDALGVGVSGANATGNSIRGNSIADNTNLGIALDTVAVLPNDPGDADSGPNDLQNYPVITSAAIGLLSSTVMEGTLDSVANATFGLEFFSNASCDASGNGEGEIFLGSGEMLTDGTGIGGFAVAVSTTVSATDWITATATGPAGSTSEFSACFGPALPCDQLAPVPFGQTITAADSNTLIWAAAEDVHFVKGDLAGVSTYSTLADGSLSGATSLDISSDSPVAGNGLYYLVRLETCGTWQNVSGAEPGRDSALP